MSRVWGQGLIVDLGDSPVYPAIFTRSTPSADVNGRALPAWQTAACAFRSLPPPHTDIVPSSTRCGISTKKDEDIHWENYEHLLCPRCYLLWGREMRIVIVSEQVPLHCSTEIGFLLKFHRRLVYWISWWLSRTPNVFLSRNWFV